jgi:putative Holliday junction resolvase
MGDGRIVGIDYGTKRVGLAMADPLQMFAQPVGTFDPDEAVRRLKAIHAEEGIGTVVIGWPLEEDGREGDSTRRVDRYVRRLRNALGRIEVVRWDERDTSEEARDRLAGRGPVHEGRVDTAAAGLILQEYLDSRARAPGEPE